MWWKRRKAGCIIKVDLEKAYARIDWGFLMAMLQQSSFGLTFQELIMNTISSTTLSVCWNGIPLQPFTPSWGLRQGAPLSPYLFVLCMEVLGQVISREIQESRWLLVSIAPSCPKISHIQFADDLLLCEEVSFSQAQKMQHVLTSFCGISGQRVNRHKSRI